MINKFLDHGTIFGFCGGGTAVMRGGGGHIAHGESPTRESPVSICEFKYESENICWSGSSNSHFNMREVIYQKQNTLLTNSICTI